MQPDTTLPKPKQIKKLTLLINQTSTNAPTLTILQNDFTGTLTPTRVQSGTYRITNSLPEFTANKTTTLINNYGETNYQTSIGQESTTQIIIYSSQLFLDGTDIIATPVDGLLINNTIQIETYV